MKVDFPVRAGPTTPMKMSPSSLRNILEKINLLHIIFLLSYYHITTPCPVLEQYGKEN